MRGVHFSSLNRNISTLKEMVSRGDIPFDTVSTQLRYRETGKLSWNEVEGIAMNVPDTNRIVHTVEINGLVEETQYEFQTSTTKEAVYLTWKNDPSLSMVVHWQTLKPIRNQYNEGFSVSETHKFKTTPKTITSKFNVAQISDTHGGGEHMETVFKRIGEHATSVIVHSGDVATGNGGSESPSSWYDFFYALNHAIDVDGNLIPMLPNVGNHETWGGSSGVQYGDNNTGLKPDFETKQRGDAEWYYCFFPTFLIGYSNIVFGDYLSIWQVDPGITTRMDDGQDIWLQDTLTANNDIPNKLISLHYNPWSAGRRHFHSYDNAVRNQVAPIWEEFKPIVFTGHDHVWSVSPPIKGGTVEESGIDHENGTYYMGAGTANVGTRESRNPHTKWWIDDCIGTAWGYFDFENADAEGYTTEPREPHPEDGKVFDWQEGSHYWLISCDYGEKTMTAYNAYNEIIHSFTTQN